MALLSIAGRDDVGPMQGFVERHGLDGLFPHVVDGSGELWRRFGISGQPAWVFVDDSGASERIFGGLTHEELQTRLEELAAS